MRTNFPVLFLLSTHVPAHETGKLHIRVVDKRTGKPTPCRIHLKDAAGKVVKAAGLPAWHDHFVCGGEVTLDVPAGAYRYEIERGPEYSQAAGGVRVAAAASTPVKVSVERLVDLTAEGWWPGELHVHRPVEDIELLMRAEDLHVAPVITWWNKRNMWGNEKRLPAEPLVKFDTNRFYDAMAGEDEREGGALLYFHLRRPLAIANAGREYPSPLTFLLMARRLMMDVWIDIEKPFWWDVPVWLASGQIDSIGIANNHMCRDRMYESEAWGKARDVKRLPPPLGTGAWSQEIYYHVLNAGLRIPPSAGSASGVLPNPVGHNRVYVHTGGELSYAAWWSGLRAGRVFVTNGPLLRVRVSDKPVSDKPGVRGVDGRLPGHVFTAAAGKELRLDVEVRLDSREPIRAVQVVQNGKVIEEKSAAEWARTKALWPVVFQSSGWFLVRVLGENDKTFRFASTGPYYVEIGGEKTAISKASAQFFLDWTRERMGRIKLEDAEQRRAVLAPHRDAEKFWQERVAKANRE
jgi:hypothetical protein